MGLAAYMLAFALLVVGVYGVVAKRNVIKIILGVLIIDYAVNMLLVLIGYRRDGVAPILSEGQDPQAWAATSVDPLPQAMVLTSIVIGLGLAALMVALAIRLYQKYDTFDMNEIRRLKG